MTYVKNAELTPEELEKVREKRRGYARNYREKQKLKKQAKEIGMVEAPKKEKQQEEVKEEPEVLTVEDLDQEDLGDVIVLRCDSCGKKIYPDRKGMYPANCGYCGDKLDYRGVEHLEEHDHILVCSVCGALTWIDDGDEICCSSCGTVFEVE